MNQWLGVYCLCLALGFLLVTRLAWKNSSLPGKSYSVALVAAAFWAAGYGSELLLIGSGVLWAYAAFIFKMLGQHICALVLLMFALTYVGLKLEARRFMWLGAPFSIVPVLLVGNQTSGWYALGFATQQQWGLESLSFVPQWAMNYGLTYNMVVLGAWLVMLLFRTSSFAWFYQRPSILMGAVWSLPFGIAAIQGAGAKGWDWSSLLLLAPMLGSWQVVKWQFLQRSPAAYAQALEQIPDALFVTDQDHVLIDQNASAAHLLARQVGQPFTPRLEDGSEQVIGDRTFSVKLAAFDGLDTSVMAWLWRDISPLKAAERELEQKNTELEATNAMQIETNLQLKDTTNQLVQKNMQLDQMVRQDSLTKIANFFELTNQLGQRQHHQQARAVLFFDIKKFSKNNQKLGLQGSDKLLFDFAQELASFFAPQGFVARHSGDKFVVILPCSLGQAQQRAEQWQQHLQNKKIAKIPLEVWVGIAATPEHPASRLLEYAERAARVGKQTEQAIHQLPAIRLWGRGIV
jgi:diguanylate cyclase (GGDEF)-like protein